MGRVRDNQLTDTKVIHQETGILYGIDESPPWYLCILLAFQQFLTCFSVTVSYPIIISSAICIAGDNVGLSELINTVIFVTGFSSILQTAFGVRLPIIQSASFAFVTPVIVLMRSKCPALYTSDNSTMIDKGSDEHKAIWQSNLCELQGALLVASVVQIIVGFSGLFGILMRYIGPLTVAPTITLIGLSLFEMAASQAQGQWWICMLTIFLVILFSQFMKDVAIPCPCLKISLRVFALFPILLGIIIPWILCAILTETNVFPTDPHETGYLARTDVNSDSLEKSPWFRLPYPGQWGVPKVTLSGVMGVLAALAASGIESVGDYYACARIAGAPPPPGSAISRGIGMEGITCLLSAAWGTPCGTTSYCPNVGAIAITKVASRSVVLVAGVLMIFLGCFGKFGALFVTIPEPVVAGLLFVMMGMVTSVGISNLQYVDLNSSRNMFVFGFSIFFGLGMPIWLSQHPDAIDTGNDTVDQALTVLCGTSMLVGGMMAFVLDNAMKGSPEERGIFYTTGGMETDPTTTDMSIYDLPFIQPLLNRYKLARYIPFLPNFVGDKQKLVDVNGEMHTSQQREEEGLIDEEDGGKVPFKTNGSGNREESTNFL